MHAENVFLYDSRCCNIIWNEKEDVKGSYNDGCFKNAERFMGYADVYHMARPRGPRFVVDCLINYLGYFPQTVVDLGCGTGLSTRLWGTAAAEVIGVEPSPDMIAYAQEHRVPKQNIRFVNAFAHETGLAPECADLVTCSQSFHWMEPEETLQEVNRILKPGGIFATYDCDWPPVCDRRAEEAYNDLQRRIQELASATKDYADSFLRWEKSEHLSRIQESGFFGYTREIVFRIRRSVTHAVSSTLRSARGACKPCCAWSRRSSSFACPVLRKKCMRFLRMKFSAWISATECASG